MIKMTVDSVMHNKARVFLVFLLSAVSFFLSLNAITDAFAFTEQTRMNESLFTSDPSLIYRVDVAYLDDWDEGGGKISAVKDFVRTIPGVQYCGAFDETGLFFRELENNDLFIGLNRDFYAGTFYAETPKIADVVFVDPEIAAFTALPLDPADFEPVMRDGEAFLPIYVGINYKSAISIGDRLTVPYNGVTYIVNGYIEDELWFHDDDTVAMPPEGLSHKFVAPFSELDKTDNMTQLATIGKIMFVLEEPNGATLDAINSSAVELGMKINTVPIEDWFALWVQTNYEIIQSFAWLAVIVFMCCASSIISFLCVSILLKKKEYGARIAFGCTKSEIAKSLILEAAVLELAAALAAFGWIYYQTANPGESHFFNPVYLNTLRFYAAPVLAAFAGCHCDSGAGCSIAL